MKRGAEASAQAQCILRSPPPSLRASVSLLTEFRLSAETGHLRIPSLAHPCEEITLTLLSTTVLGVFSSQGAPQSEARMISPPLPHPQPHRAGSLRGVVVRGCPPFPPSPMFSPGAASLRKPRACWNSGAMPTPRLRGRGDPWHGFPHRRADVLNLSLAVPTPPSPGGPQGTPTPLRPHPSLPARVQEGPLGKGCGKDVTE